MNQTFNKHGNTNHKKNQNIYFFKWNKYKKRNSSLAKYTDIILNGKILTQIIIDYLSSLKNVSDISWEKWDDIINKNEYYDRIFLKNKDNFKKKEYWETLYDSKIVFGILPEYLFQNRLIIKEHTNSVPSYYVKLNIPKVVSTNIYFLRNKVKETNNYLDSIRFGTPLNVCGEEGSIKKIVEFIFNDKNAPRTKSREIIYVSLLDDLNSVRFVGGIISKTPLSRIPIISDKVTESRCKKNEFILMEKHDNIHFFHIPFSGLAPRQNINFDKLIEKIKIINKAHNIKNEKFELFIENITLPNKFSDKLIQIVILLSMLQYKTGHILMYHCKSGKDRTGVFFALHQSFITYIDEHGFLEFDKLNKQLLNMIILSQNKYNNICNLEIKKQIKDDQIDFRYYNFLLLTILVTLFSSGVMSLKVKDSPVFLRSITDETCRKFYIAEAKHI